MPGEQDQKLLRPAPQALDRGTLETHLGGAQRADLETGGLLPRLRSRVLAGRNRRLAPGPRPPPPPLPRPAPRSPRSPSSRARERPPPGARGCRPARARARSRPARAGRGIWRGKRLPACSRASRAASRSRRVDSRRRRGREPLADAGRAERRAERDPRVRERCPCDRGSRGEWRGSRRAGRPLPPVCPP